MGMMTVGVFPDRRLGDELSKTGWLASLPDTRPAIKSGPGDGD